MPLSLIPGVERWMCTRYCYDRLMDFDQWVDLMTEQSLTSTQRKLISRLDEDAKTTVGITKAFPNKRHPCACT